ncbi:DUF4212 domain-containing protein [Haloterrigena sp. SYSU A558-1]|uniref:DUF4212 domain-containing protein n=1 Tax=Haloterrigena gelatinilytica TaxID=2741724 RepID=A0ABX2L9Y6_9EURY|nr:DUF4212 domain-containing protein [Haloterrigena gelatinilytica]NUC73075.1 DUF4212 domain-containing protein [Haloterrigena gelatinilytica]
MTDNNTHSADDESFETDGGVSDVEREKQIDYLDVEINLLKPATPFMRDHNRIILRGFAIWAVIVFGPITLTRLFPGVMTTTMPVLGFPFHYFLIAVGAPGGALLLSVWYVRKRDEIDEKYDIEQIAATDLERTDTGSQEPAATDGGLDQ